MFTFRIPGFFGVCCLLLFLVVPVCPGVQVYEIQEDLLLENISRTKYLPPPWDMYFPYKRIYPIEEEKGRKKSVKKIVMENEVIRLELLPEMGASISGFVYKPAGWSIIDFEPEPEFFIENNGQRYFHSFGGSYISFPVAEYSFPEDDSWEYQIYRSEKKDRGGVILSKKDELLGLKIKLRIEIKKGQGLLAFQKEVTNSHSWPVQYNLRRNFCLSPVEELILWMPKGVRRKISLNELPDKGISFHDQKGGYLGFYDESKKRGMVRIFPEQCLTDVSVSKRKGDGLCLSWERSGQDMGSVPGGAVQRWVEFWFPVTGIESLVWASPKFLINLGYQEGEESVFELGVSFPGKLNGAIFVNLDEKEIWKDRFYCVPGRAYHRLIQAESWIDEQVVTISIKPDEGREMVFKRKVGEIKNRD